MESYYIPVIIICILFSAFFSGIEIAYISANRLRVAVESNKGSINAKIISWFFNRPSKFLGSMLLGNNIALVVYGIFMSVIIEPYLLKIWNNPLFILIGQTILSTLIILFFAEFLPKALFRLNPNGILVNSAIPLILIYICFLLPTTIIISISEIVIFLITGKKNNTQNLTFGKVDLDNYINEHTRGADLTNEILDHEIEIFKNALDFSKVKVRDCMIPRTEIIAVNINESIDNLRKKFIETHLSKILVYENNIDEIIGYVHSYELFKSPLNIKSILLPITIVPETMPAKDLLQLFTRQSRSIALVVDEYGGTSGMVCMEDVIEEIFGEIEDEHDVEELIEKDLGNNTWVFSGRHEIDYLKNKYKLNLPEEETYETLAGYILHHTQDIPQKNAQIKIGEYLYTILKTSGKKIELVKISTNEKD
jgi:CBS domain containing-hemolysin-like protein